MKTLLLLEHDGSHLRKSTLATRSAAQTLTFPSDAVIFSSASSQALEEARRLPGVEKIWHVDIGDSHPPFAEDITSTLLPLARQYTHIFAPATTFGKNVLPRLAGCLNVGQVSDVTDILSADTFERPIYAGNALAYITTHDPIVVATIRPTAFPTCDLNVQATLPVESLPFKAFALSARMTYVGLSASPSDRPDLSAARVVISGGRALGSADNFRLLEELAHYLKGAVGASRAAVDAGYAPNDYQVGQTGKIVAPDLYIAVGLSGAAQHLAGMKDSKIIVAINTDPEAPICQIADYTLVADLFDAIPSFIQELGKNHG